MSKAIVGWQQDTEKIVKLTYRVRRELCRADGEKCDIAVRGRAFDSALDTKPH